MTRDYSIADLMPATAVVVIGIAECSHLCGILFSLPFHLCALITGVAMVGAILVLAVLSFAVVGRRRREETEGKRKRSGAEKLLTLLFAIIVLSQLVFILTNQSVYRCGDMTVETVGSFLETDALYRVNPMTGQAYEQGIPMRLKILCLPTLYGSLCRLLHLSPQLLVFRVAPVLTLAGCYGAYAALGRCLFGEDGKKRGVFLVAVALIIWAGSYLYGMDGFGILFSGWRGVTIRNLVLLPWVFSLCLRKKWILALLCVIAEACLVWTLYGMGACLFVIVGMAVLGFIRSRVESKTIAEEPAGEEAAK